MAALWLPSDDRHALALREPNLLVPRADVVSLAGRQVDFSALNAYGLNTYAPCVEGGLGPVEVFTRQVALFSGTNADQPIWHSSPNDVMTRGEVGVEVVTSTTGFNGWQQRARTAANFGDRYSGSGVLSWFVSGFVRASGWLSVSSTYEGVIGRVDDVFGVSVMGGNPNDAKLRCLVATSGTTGWTTSNDKSIPNAWTGTGAANKQFFIACTYNGSTLSMYMSMGNDPIQLLGTATVTGTIQPRTTSTRLNVVGSSSFGVLTLTQPVTVTGLGAGRTVWSLNQLENLRAHRQLFLRPANSTPYLISVPTGGATVTLSSPTATATGPTTAAVGCTVTYT